MTAIRYMHHTPGRLRLKGHHFRCHGEAARKALAQLRAAPGVEEVTLNPRAGSLTVRYDTARTSQAGLLAVLDETGCLHAPAALRVAHGRPEGTPRTEMVALFGKALMGALAQRTAMRLVGGLL